MSSLLQDVSFISKLNQLTADLSANPQLLHSPELVNFVKYLSGELKANIPAKTEPKAAPKVEEPTPPPQAEEKASSPAADNDNSPDVSATSEDEEEKVVAPEEPEYVNLLTIKEYNEEKELNDDELDKQYGMAYYIFI